MSYFHRGRHRANRHSILVEDLRGQLEQEYLPTGVQVGAWPVVRNAATGQEFYQFTGKFLPAAKPSLVSGVILMRPPEGVAQLPALEVDA